MWDLFSLIKTHAIFIEVDLWALGIHVYVLQNYKVVAGKGRPGTTVDGESWRDRLLPPPLHGHSRGLTSTQFS